MELGNQIKKYRGELNMSQDVLAEKIYVSRQTVSNWENEKSYPDVNSLIRLSEVFSVSLDQLIKGDVEEMKALISEEEKNEYKRMANIYSVMFVVAIIIPFPLIYFLKWIGIAIYAIYYVATFAVALRIEKLKSKLNIHTYKEIVAFYEGKKLDEIESAKEEAKRPYQSILLIIGSGVLTLLVAFIFYMIIKMFS